MNTGTPFTSSFVVNFPTAAADSGPRAGRLPTDSYLVNGPTLNRTLLQQQFPGGQLLRNTILNGFQVLDDMHLELNERPTSFDTRHPLVVSGRAVIPRTGGLNVGSVAGR